MIENGRLRVTHRVMRGITDSWNGNTVSSTVGGCVALLLCSGFPPVQEIVYAAQVPLSISETTTFPTTDQGGGDCPPPPLRPSEVARTVEDGPTYKVAISPPLPRGGAEPTLSVPWYPSSGKKSNKRNNSVFSEGAEETKRESGDKEDESTHVASMLEKGGGGTHYGDDQKGGIPPIVVQEEETSSLAPGDVQEKAPPSAPPIRGGYNVQGEIAPSDLIEGGKGYHSPRSMDAVRETGIFVSPISSTAAVPNEVVPSFPDVEGEIDRSSPTSTFSREDRASGMVHTHSWEEDAIKRAVTLLPSVPPAAVQNETVPSPQNGEKVDCPSSAPGLSEEDRASRTTHPWEEDAVKKAVTLIPPAPPADESEDVTQGGEIENEIVERIASLFPFQQGGGLESVSGKAKEDHREEIYHKDQSPIQGMENSWVRGGVPRKLSIEELDEVHEQLSSWFPKPLVVTREDWGAPAPSAKALQVKNFDIRRIIVHHTSSVNHRGTFMPRYMRAITKYHRGIGFSDFGYRAVVALDGTLYEGFRGVGQGRLDALEGGFASDHARKFNSHSYGVALDGDYENRDRFDPQSPAGRTLMDLLVYVATRDGRIRVAVNDAGEMEIKKMVDIIGHRDTGHSNTDCPGKTVHKALPEIRKEVRRRIKEVVEQKIRENYR
ncbi:N-acetylmuramoyl-L-alanine amidase [Pasteuria penetrans]|uniref:N-acetylmuramoyl-L-alanine amidase n=1 Tax=Pasteuria penetrans TaxID=86005 RepID=UPI000FAC93A7|nr:N-acetylmuramoyl-L-alanine amidase [Pasteuria penetrans]